MRGRRGKWSRGLGGAAASFPVGAAPPVAEGSGEEAGAGGQSGIRFKSCYEGSGPLLAELSVELARTEAMGDAEKGRCAVGPLGPITSLWSGTG